MHYYNTSYNACPPPAWLTSDPVYDQSTGLPLSVTAGGEATPVILEEPGGVAQMGNDALFLSASLPNNTREAVPPTVNHVISVESNKQSDTVINVSVTRVSSVESNKQSDTAINVSVTRVISVESNKQSDTAINLSLIHI